MKILLIHKPWLHLALTVPRFTGDGDGEVVEMFIRKSEGPRIAVLPDGRKISLSDLPPAGTTRWVAKRKAQIVQAVMAGLISAEKACERYSLTAEELQEWCQAVARHGVGALQATKLQLYRQP